MPAVLEFCAKGFHDAEVFTEVPLVGTPVNAWVVLDCLPQNEVRRGARQATCGTGYIDDATDAGRENYCVKTTHSRCNQSSFLG